MRWKYFHLSNLLNLITIMTRTGEEENGDGKNTEDLKKKEIFLLFGLLVC